VEVLIGTILNRFYNKGKIPAQDIAKIGQFAENQFFGKPCGLMDQMTCAVGGIITIDFKDPAKPGVKKIDFDFKLVDYSVIVIDTGGSHADLTDDYGAIPQEMRSVANHFQAETCRELKRGQVVRSVAVLREKLGDRPVLRTLHFLKENRRVIDQVDALKVGNFARFLALVNDSGNSSAKWLQNSFSPKTPQDQGITLALALTELFLENKKTGACRVHGGGFAGTIQVFMPNENLREYQKLMESIFGPESITILDIRPEGTLYLGRL
jgi:galactokinase